MARLRPAGNTRTRTNGSRAGSRRLSFESLEDRLALTTFTVTSLTDGPINLTDSVVTLRDAIQAANQNVAAFPGGPVGDSLFRDTIQFRADLVGTLTLTQGQLTLRSSMSIVGPSAQAITVSGGTSSRVFNVTDSTVARLLLTIRGLTITKGQSPTGGGILNSESLRVEDCLIVLNSSPQGGGIYNSSAGVLTLVNSHIDGNSTTAGGSDNGGSGLFNLGTATLTDSSVNNNFGTGQRAPIANSGTLTIQNSIVRGNTQNSNSAGIDNSGTLTIRDSTIADNDSQGGSSGVISNGAGGTATLLNCTVSGNLASGVGGIANSGTITLQQCTISGNSGPGFVGGVSNGGTMSLQNCTISSNIGGQAGGVYNDVDASLKMENCTVTLNRASVGIGGFENESFFGATLHNTIVVDNFRGAGTMRSDIFATVPVDPNCSNNLIGVLEVFTPSGLADGENGNQVGVTDVGLGPLASNGGATLTHALLAGSPAIEAGTNAKIPPDAFDLDGDGIFAEPIPFDQRGTGFSRIVGTTVDIGAYESLAPLPGDYNRNGIVEAADYTVWRDTLGQSGLAQFSGADGDGSGSIGQGDYDVWREHFGQTLATGLGAGAGVASSAIADSALEIGEPVAVTGATAGATKSESDSEEIRSLSFTTLPVGFMRRDLSSQSAAWIDAFRYAGAKGDQLLVLLAIDRVERISQRDNTLGNDEHVCGMRADDGNSSRGAGCAAITTAADLSSSRSLGDLRCSLRYGV